MDEEFLRELIGLDEAEAQARVEQMGLVVRVIHEGEAMSLERRRARDRITLTVKDGRVVKARRN